MSRRPSFRDPFAPVSQWGTRGGTGGTAAPSPLDPGPSQYLPRSFLPSLDSSLRRFSDSSVQTGPVEPEEEAPPQRKGSLARLKDAGRALRNPSSLRKVVQLLGGKRTQAAGQSLSRTVKPEETHRPAPARPARPESLDSDLLDIMDRYELEVIDSGLGTSMDSSDASVAPVIRATRNALAIPRVTRPGPPQTPFPVDHGEQEHLWTVIQRNKIRVPPPTTERGWVTGGMLGSGGFGRVYLVYNTKTRKQCAMKVVNFGNTISRSCCRGLLNELRVLSKLASDPEAVPFLLRPCQEDGGRWFWRSKAGYLHIITDAHTGGDLGRYKGMLTDESLVLVCAELVLGLDYLHKKQFLHHDLKPCNVLVSSGGHCVIADFGGARDINDERVGMAWRHSDTTLIVTERYAAPELLKPLEDNKCEEYGRQVDYWSLAATVVSLIMEDDYLPGDRNLGSMANKVEKVRSRMIKMRARPELQKFVMDLFKWEPSLRPVYPGIRSHPFFRGLDWDDVLAQKNPAIPFDLEAIPTGHGAESYGNPQVHNAGDSVADFLQEARLCNLNIPEDSSFDVEQHHAYLAAAL